MLTESCVACGADAPLGDAVHLLVNPKDGSGVTDGYLCRSCYEEHVEPLLPEDEDEGDVDDSEGGKADDAGAVDGVDGEVDDAGEDGEADDAGPDEEDDGIDNEADDGGDHAAREV